MTNESENVIAIFDQLAKGRKYASFFEWLDREGKELGVGEELLRTLSPSSDLRLDTLKNCKPDPPDLVCENGKGERIAIEVSEVVCQEAVEINQRAQTAEEGVYRVWGPGDLEAHIRASLARKDKGKLNGGPYQQIWVCLFTDEMMLTHEKTSAELSAVEFGPFDQVTDAFLLFSYEPGKKSYPVLRLNLRSGQSRA